LIRSREPRQTSLLALGLSLALLAGCGGAAPPASSPTKHPQPAEATTPETPPLVVEYVVIHRRWVERLLPIAPADLKTWSDAPENAAATNGSFHHILVKVPGGEKDPGLAAKKKAQGIIARLDKGEDFAKLARQLSDDASTRDSGGEYTPEQVKELPPALSAAFAALEPGKTTAQPVRTKDGFHVVRKDRASDDEIERAYRKAKAPEVAKKLGEDLLVRLNGGTPSRPAIAEAVEAVLGERGVNDADRPKAHVVDRDRLAQVRLSAAAKAALETFARSARPGDQLPSPAVDGDTILVARAALALGDGAR